MPYENEMPQTSGDFMMAPQMEPQYQSLRVPHENIDQQQQNMTNFIPQTNYNQVRQKQITCVSTINPTDPKVFWPLLNKHYYSLETS